MSYITFTESEIFKSYEQDFKNYTSDLGNRLLQMAQENRIKAEEAQRDCERDLEQAEQCIQQMESEASSYPQQQKRQIKDRLKTYKNDWQRMKKEYKQWESQNKHERELDNLIDSEAIKQFNKDKQITNIYSQQNQKLQDVKRQAYDLEDQSGQIQVQLRSQSEQIENSTNKNRTIRDDLRSANSLISTMQDNILKRKLLLYGLIIFLLLVVTIIIYMNTSSSSNSNDIIKQVQENENDGEAGFKNVQNQKDPL